MALFTLEKGTVIGPYKLDKELGSGSFASVWSAWHTRLRARHALKILHWNITREETRERFITEGAVAYELSRANDQNAKHVIRVHEMSREGEETQWIAMELVTGGDLQGFYAQNLVSLHESLRILRDIALALQLAHTRTINSVPSPIYHRDLKPANVLLTEARQVRVSDWGLARVMHLGNEDGGGSVVNGTAIGTGMGTPGISAPEQLAGDSTDGASADVFSLGVMIAILIARFNPGPTGMRKLHYQAVQDEDLADVPQTLRELIEEMVRVNPAERPYLDEVIARLEAAMEQFCAEDPPFRPRFGAVPKPIEPVPTPLKTPEPEAAEPIVPPAAPPPPSVVLLPEQEQFPGTTYGDPPNYGRWVAGAVIGVVAMIAVAVAMFWPKGEPNAPEPVKEVATVEPPIVNPPKPEPLVEVTPKVEPTPEPPIVTPTPVVEVAPMVKVEVKPKVEPKPVVKPPVLKPPPEEPKPETPKVTTASATITTHPETAKVGDRIEIVAKVAIPDGAAVKTVRLYYRGETGAYQNDILYDAHDPSKQDRAKFDGTTATAMLAIKPGFGKTVAYKFDVRIEGDNSPHWSAEKETQIPTE